MKTRSQKTLKEYGLNEETFTALWEAQNGCCAICGIPEAELEQKYSGPNDWASDRMLHIDHQHGTSPRHIRGLLWGHSRDKRCFVGISMGVQLDKLQGHDGAVEA
jgi:hypothetical protein